MAPKQLPLTDKEMMTLLDWLLPDERDEDGSPLVVKAVDIIHMTETEIIAACFQKGQPIYLMSSDCKLFYHHRADDILEQFIPIHQFQVWKNSWDRYRIFRASQQFPKGWHYYDCFHDEFIIVLDSYWKDFRTIAISYNSPVHVLLSFPRIIEKVLNL